MRNAYWNVGCRLAGACNVHLLSIIHYQYRDILWFIRRVAFTHPSPPPLLFRSYLTFYTSFISSHHPPSFVPPFSDVHPLLRHCRRHHHLRLLLSIVDSSWLPAAHLLPARVSSETSLTLTLGPLVTWITERRPLRKPLPRSFPKRDGPRACPTKILIGLQKKRRARLQSTRLISSMKRRIVTMVILIGEWNSIIHHTTAVLQCCMLHWNMDCLVSTGTDSTLTLNTIRV